MFCIRLFLLCLFTFPVFCGCSSSDLSHRRIPSATSYPCPYECLMDMLSQLPENVSSRCQEQLAAMPWPYSSGNSPTNDIPPYWDGHRKGYALGLCNYRCSTHHSQMEPHSSHAAFLRGWEDGMLRAELDIFHRWLEKQPPKGKPIPPISENSSEIIQHRPPSP